MSIFATIVQSLSVPFVPMTGLACLWRSNEPACHRFGIGMMRHLAVLVRDAGLKELVAEVLPENTAMLKLFKKFGFRPDSKRSPQVVHLTLQLS